MLTGPEEERSPFLADIPAALLEEGPAQTRKKQEQIWIFLRRSSGEIAD